MNVSLLMKDSSYGDCQKETMLDFILSWTLRRASSAYANEKTILYNYCREILFRLLDIKEYDNIEVCSVETLKQWEHIDLHTNIELSINGKPEWHAILIENKIYTPTHDDQLKRYRQIFDEAYKDGNFCLHYVLITCHESPSEQLRHDCSENGFICLPILDLFPNDRGKDSESDIFNEFWLREW